ncbi:carboxymuconolactone decarboxylase family protein [Photobacterium sp. TY1-4]|uniref:carboxymuconolactone decarboxylase family protein n=1 Tax=Photobacterium sp. TY1-4 TaxID=2899122 RepID=UPI0021BEC014|nr:carboxymuconolactone decarboxylase family protein [Photobacterium sp. TY1-4]UXI02154.1 carboxymuconolactone decarboxylase family protein [Photobacterium sp. TY1-4]
MSPRLPYFDQPEGLDPEGCRVYDQIHQSRGHVVGVFALLLNSPSLAEYTAQLGGYLRFETQLPPPVKELVILTTLREHLCQFEWAAHETAARTAGIPVSLIEQIKAKAPIAPGQLAGVNAAVLIHSIRELIEQKRISDASYRALTADFSAREITDIVALAGYYAMVSCILNAAELAAPANRPHLPEPDRHASPSNRTLTE